MSEEIKTPSSRQEELQARLAQLKAEARQLEAAREQRDGARELERAVEKQERANRDTAAIAAVEEKHGEIDDRKFARIDTDLGVIVLRRPVQQHYKRFRDKRAEARSEDLEQLVRPCVVHPSVPAWEAMIEEQPGILDRCADMVVHLAGFRMKEASGK